MNVNVGKRLLPRVVQTAEYHSGYPEGYDVVARYQCVCGVEIFVVLGLVGPAQSGEGPQRRAEPGIKSIPVLYHLRSAFGALVGCGYGNGFVTAFLVCAVVGGNPVSPPELSGNAPVSYIFHPVKVAVFKALGNKTQFSRFYHVDGGFRKLFHGNEPLL